MRVFHILVILVAFYLSVFDVKAFAVNAGYVKVSTSCTNTAIAEGVAVNQVLKCSNYFEKIGKYDSAFRVLFKCSTKNHVCLKQIGQLVFDHDIRHGFDLVISVLEKVDQEQNSWVENMLGGLLVKRAVKSDILRARELFKKAYGRGSSTSVQNLAELEFIVENYESSMFYLEKLRLLDLKRKSQEQYVNWVRLLGQHHHYGFGVEKNVNKAKQLYSEIVNIDKSGATHYLMADAEYHDGNTSLSIELFKESANLGYINAITKLADAYLFGTRVKKDLDKSLEYYKHASSLGIVSAYYNQSVIYQKQKKYIEMKVALIKAAKLGHIKAKKITVENDIKIENYEFNDGILKEKNNLSIKR